MMMPSEPRKGINIRMMPDEFTGYIDVIMMICMVSIYINIDVYVWLCPFMIPLVY